MRIFNVYLAIGLLAFALLINAGHPVSSFGADKNKKNNLASQMVTGSDVSSKISAENDYKLFKKLLKNLTKKNCQEFIKNNVNNFFIPLVKTNLEAIEEEESGFGKCFLVLKNGTRLNLNQLSEDSKYINFKAKYVRVDPETISHLEMHSPNEELEPYLEFRWGNEYVIWLDSGEEKNFSEKPHKGNTLLPGSRTNNIIKYKIKEALDIWHKKHINENTLDKYSLIEILKINNLQGGLKDYRLLAHDDKLVVAAELMDMSLLVSESSYKVIKLYRERYRDSQEMIEEFDTFNEQKDRMHGPALKKLQNYALFTESDLLILPGTHGKNDYFPFVSFH
jgi:hypothetical protein